MTRIDKEREDRLAAALRANLRRRKEQARGQPEAVDDRDSEGGNRS